MLKKCNFEPVPGWENLFANKKLGLVLSVYVDDFKLAGVAENLNKAYLQIKEHIDVDPHTPFSKYLGMHHAPITLTDEEATHRVRHYQNIIDWAVDQEAISGTARKKATTAETTKAEIPHTGGKKRDKKIKIRGYTLGRNLYTYKPVYGHGIAL